MRCARCLREPTTRDWERIGRVARYLRWTAGTCVTMWPTPFVSGEPLRITRWVDRDGAGHHVSRRYCSGRLLALSDAVITSRARMQATPVLSSGEAELYTIGFGFVETLFGKHLLEGLGHDVRAEVRTDSHVARSVVLSQGLRTMKHIELRFPWRTCSHWLASFHRKWPISATIVSTTPCQHLPSNIVGTFCFSGCCHMTNLSEAQF